MISLGNNASKHGTFSEKDFNSLMKGYIDPRASALLAAIDLPKKGEQTVVIISPRDDGYYDVKAIRM